MSHAKQTVLEYYEKDFEKSGANVIAATELCKISEETLGMPELDHMLVVDDVSAIIFGSTSSISDETIPTTLEYFDEKKNDILSHSQNFTEMKHLPIIGNAAATIAENSNHCPVHPDIAKFNQNLGKDDLMINPILSDFECSSDFEIPDIVLEEDD